MPGCHTDCDLPRESRSPALATTLWPGPVMTDVIGDSASCPETQHGGHTQRVIDEW